MTSQAVPAGQHAKTFRRGNAYFVYSTCAAYKVGDDRREIFIGASSIELLREAWLRIADADRGDFDPELVQRTVVIGAREIEPQAPVDLAPSRRVLP